MIDAVNKVLAQNAASLNNVISQVKSKAINNADLVLELSRIHSSLNTLEVMTEPFNRPHIVPFIKPEPAPVPFFVEDTENDNPEAEDADHKKQRADNRSFFG